MNFNYFIKRIRVYSIISFLIPLLAINACLHVYKFLGSTELNRPFNFSEPAVLYSLNEFSSIRDPNINNFVFVDCPKYESKFGFVTESGEVLNKVKYSDYEIDNLLNVNLAFNEATTGVQSDKMIYIVLKKAKIKNIKIIQNKNKINFQCAKNSPFFYFLISNFSTIHTSLVKTKYESLVGFSEIKNPYVYGEVSISRTARFFPSNLIFKPFIILSSLFIFLYWRNNFNLFKELKNKSIIKNTSKTFFYFGVLSCIFLTLHSIFLGVDLNSDLFSKVRRLIIILFIFFEVLAQFYLTRQLLKHKNSIQDYINPIIVNLKLTFISMVVFSTIIIFALMIFYNLSTPMKNILEWNYFSILLIYYFLSSLLWNYKKT